MNAQNTQRLGRVLKAFVTNAWPHFWGVRLRAGREPAAARLFVALLVWIGVLYAWALVQGLLKWRRGEDVSGYQLVFGYFVLHLAITTVSSYGSRFETSTPLSYVGPLYSVAFCIPALVLQSRLSRTAKALALLPFGLFVANNLVANAAYPKNFFAALGERGLSDVTRYPNEKNPFLRLSREHGLEAGYLGRAFKGDSAKHQNFQLNLEGFGVVTYADLSSERYVESALAVDAARRIFWVGIDRGGLRMIGATATSEPVRQFDYYYDFRKDLRETTVIPAAPAGAPQSRAGSASSRTRTTTPRGRSPPRRSGTRSSMSRSTGRSGSGRS